MRSPPRVVMLGVLCQSARLMGVPWWCSEGPAAVERLVEGRPELVHDVATGGATPLHVCGMSQRGQHSAAALLAHGADVHARDTYGYTALHRMASNNLPEGARALLRGGADANSRAEGTGETPLQVALESHASAVVDVLRAALNGEGP